MSAPPERAGVDDLIDPLLEKTLDALVKQGVYVSGVNPATGRPYSASHLGMYGGGASSELFNRIAALANGAAAVPIVAPSPDPPIFISFSRTHAVAEALFLADYFRKHTSCKVIANPNLKNDLTHLIKGVGAVLILITEDYLASPQCLAELHASNVQAPQKIFLCTLTGKPVDMKKLIKRASDGTTLMQAIEWEPFKTKYQITDSPNAILASIKTVLSCRPYPMEFKLPQDAEMILRALEVPCRLDSPFKGIQPGKNTRSPMVFHSVGPLEFVTQVQAIRALKQPDAIYLTTMQKFLSLDPMNSVPFFHAGLAPVLIKWLHAPVNSVGPEVPLACLNMLYQLANTHVQCQALLRLGAHDAGLVALTNYPKNTLIVCCAVQLITIIANEALLVGDPPLTGPYIRLVRVLLRPWLFDLKVVQGGLLLLAAMASRASVAQLIQAGALNWLGDAMRIYGTNKAVAEAGLTAIRKLACTPEMKLTLVQSGIGRLLLESFSKHSKDSALILHTCWAVEVLSSHPDNCLPIFDLGLGVMLISSLRNHINNKNICRCAAAGLKNLASSPLIAGALFDLSAGSTLIEVLTMHTSKIDAKMIQTLAMWEASVDDQEVLTAYIRISSWSLVEDFEPASDLDITRQVLGCLNFFCNKASLLEPLFSLGAGKAAIYTVRLYMGDPETTTLVCEILAKLALEKQNRDVLFTLGAAQVAVDILRVYRQSSVSLVNVAGDLLLHLAGDYSRWQSPVDADGMPWRVMDEGEAASVGGGDDDEEDYSVDGDESYTGHVQFVEPLILEAQVEDNVKEEEEVEYDVAKGQGSSDACR